MRLLKIIGAVALILLTGNASAQILGQMTSARALAIGNGVAGGYAVFADGGTAVLGSLRYGLADYIEGRVRLGFYDPDHGDGSVTFGGDFKYQLWRYKENNNPFDMSLGGGLEFIDYEGGNILSFSGVVIGSIPFELKNGSVIEPYGQFHLRLQKVSWGNDSETDLKAGVNLGVVFSIARFTDFTAEIQLDDETAFAVGVDILQF